MEEQAAEKRRAFYQVTAHATMEDLAKLLVAEGSLPSDTEKVYTVVCDGSGIKVYAMRFQTTMEGE